MVTEDIDDWMTALLRSPIFQRLPPINLQKIILKLEAIDLKKGDVILDQGGEGDYYYHIKKGHCTLTRKSSPTAKEIKLHQLKTGDAFGEDALITGAPRDLTITALTDISLLRLDKQNFLSLIKEPTIKFVDHDGMSEAVKQGTIILDVRSPDEYGKFHLPGSINQPFFTLRMMIKTLDHEKSYIVVCNNGKTSEAAAFVLLKNAIDAKVLKGGVAAMLPEQGAEPADSIIPANIEPSKPANKMVENTASLQRPVARQATDNLANEFKSIFFQQLEQLIDNFSSRIDHEFGVQLGKNREKIPKEHYIKLLEYLRSVRKDIKQQYLTKVNANFDKGFSGVASNQNRQLNLTQASLLKDDLLAENHQINSIISQCEHLFFEELTSLNKLIVPLQFRQAIVGSQNPLFPDRLIRTMVEVVTPLKLNTDSRIALYKAFEAHVFSQMGFIYSELVSYCETKEPALLYKIGEAKPEMAPAPVKVEQPNAEFGLLQQKLELWRQARFPSADALIPATGNEFYEHFQIRHALQVLQQFGDDLGMDEKKQPLKIRVFKKLEQLSFDVKPKSLAKNDQDILDLVSLLFNEIERDELLQDNLKSNMLQLQSPLSAAVLGRYNIFTNLDNPVIKLLDGLFDASTFLNADQDDVQGRIAAAINKMTKEDGFEFAAWAAEADEFLAYLNSQKQQSQADEGNTKQLMQNKYALDSIRKNIAIAIENSVKGKTLPATIGSFLRDVWSDVLLDAHMHKDEHPEQWDKSMQTMDELILSVLPPADENERKHILKLLPGLIAQLRQGLKQISYDKAAQSRFFKDLAVWHIILMDKKETPRCVDVPEQSNSVMAGEMNVEPIMDNYLEQAQNLVGQTWVAFKLESVKQWAKFIWKDTETENMLFVRKNGTKMFEIPANELAGRLRLGRAFVINPDPRPLSERVLSALMGKTVG
jgi:rhodanese-related sulfurtransferase